MAERVTAQPKKYGGIISSDTLESMRSSGATDDVIADYMAGASPGFASQVSKIRKKFGGDPSATSAFLNTRFYGMADHSPEQPKGFIGRSLDRIYNNYKQDVIDIEQASEAYRSGDQGLTDTLLQTAGNVASIGFSPLAQPLQEAVVTAGKTAYENIPGLKGVAQDIGQSKFVQEGVLPAIQGASQFVTEESQRNPQLRTFGSALEGISDAGDAFLAGAAAKQAAKAAVSGARMIPQIPSAFGKGVGMTARVAAKPFGSAARGFMEGVKGQADDVTKAAAKQADNVTQELIGPAKEAVAKGMDEKLMKFAAVQNPETRSAMASMTRVAKKGAENLGGDTAHKEVLGGYMMNNLSHILETKQNVGSALGSMKIGMADDVIDLSDEYLDLVKVLHNKGVVMNDAGKITRLMGASDDNIPLLQQALDFLQPSDTGRVFRKFKQTDMWRQKMFQEMNSAKAKLQPSAGGQSAFGFAENTINDLRRSAIKKMSAGNNRFLSYNDAFENLSTEASKFLKAIGYKGKMSIDDITAKQLRSGEVALRTLGNASADVRESFTNMLKAARKYGYNSDVDEMALIRWADALEDVFPITPTRSLQGGVSRGTRDAMGNFTQDVLTSGAKRAAFNRIIDPIMDRYDWLRGMTPENRYKLLMEVLEAPPETPLIQIIDNVLPDEAADKLAKTVEGIDAEDIAPAIKEKINTPSSSDLQRLEGELPPATESPKGLSQGKPLKQGIEASPPIVPITGEEVKQSVLSAKNFASKVKSYKTPEKAVEALNDMEIEIPLKDILPPKALKAFMKNPEKLANYKPAKGFENAPLDVRVPAGSKYSIVDGIHRWAQAVAKGEKTVKARLFDVQISQLKGFFKKSP